MLLQMANWPFDHNKRWNIDYDEKESFKQFQYRMRLCLIDLEMSQAEAAVYNFLIGSQVANADYFASERLSSLFSSDIGIVEFITRLQTTFELYEMRGDSAAWEKLCEAVELCLPLSRNLNVGFRKSENKAVLYPIGIELLDQEVVNQTLSWLDGYPRVSEPFSAALRLYADAEKDKQRNLLDNLRFAIEQLLKEILHNSKSLENQQRELNSWLRDKEVHQQVVNLYNQLLFGQFRQYQNDAVKHAGEYKEQDIEFMIYLASTFMRLLLQLEQSQEAPQKS